MLINVLVFLAVGAIAGWLVGMILKGGGYGLHWNIIIGIVGGIVGGWLFGGLLASIFGEGIIGGIITAVLGAILLLWVISLFNKK
jgi:uncharacterized membrane protein YeaQ/YmgE (transglycosylase-associated protein family)